MFCKIKKSNKGYVWSGGRYININKIHTSKNCIKKIELLNIEFGMEMLI